MKKVEDCLMPQEKSQEKNLKNLKEGMRVKSYKELCGLLNEPVLNGKSKTIQLEEFERYFSYTRDGNAYIIQEVYNEPLPDLKVNANNKYIECIQTVLLSYLSKQEDGVLLITPRNLYITLGMINEKYNYKNRKDLKSIDVDMNDFNIDNFFLRSSSKLKSILQSALNSLKRRDILFWTETYRIYGEDGSMREASVSEIKKILRIRKMVKQKLGIENEYLGKNYDRFYTELNKNFKEIFGWEYVIHCYKLIYNHDIVIDEIEKNTAMLKLNKLVLEVLDEQAENFYKKKGITSDNSEERKIDEEHPFYYPVDYPIMQKKLSKATIKID